MNKFWNKIKHYWEVNDLTDVSENMSLAISVTAFIVSIIWGFISLLSGVLSFLMLDWVIRVIVITAVINTGRLLWRDRDAWTDGGDEDDEPEFL